MWDDNFSAAVDWALALATLVPVLASLGFVQDPRWIFQVAGVEVVVVGGGERLGGGQFSRHLITMMMVMMMTMMVVLMMIMVDGSLSTCSFQLLSMSKLPKKVRLAPEKVAVSRRWSRTVLSFYQGKAASKKYNNDKFWAKPCSPMTVHLA